MNKKEIIEVIARRAAKEMRDGYVVNLGIGIPTHIPNFIPEDTHITLQCENGMLGVGPTPNPDDADPNLFSAGGGCISAMPGASSFDSATSFAIIRGGHVDVTMLGALQVDQKGNLANWIIPGKRVPGMGGAMDLVVGARHTIVTMEHTARGEKKILEECTLPLTAAGKVSKIITEMGVMEVRPEGLVLTEINPEFSIEQLQEATGAKLIIADNIKNMLN